MLTEEELIELLKEAQEKYNKLLPEEHNPYLVGQIDAYYNVLNKGAITACEEDVRIND